MVTMRGVAEVVVNVRTASYSALRKRSAGGASTTPSCTSVAFTRVPDVTVSVSGALVAAALLLSTAAATAAVAKTTLQCMVFCDSFSRSRTLAHKLESSHSSEKKRKKKPNDDLSHHIVAENDDVRKEKREKTKRQKTRGL